MAWLTGILTKFVVSIKTVWMPADLSLLDTCRKFCCKLRGPGRGRYSLVRMAEGCIMTTLLLSSLWHILMILSLYHS